MKTPETEKRKHRACFTGHRPAGLSMDETRIKNKLKELIPQLEQKGITTFISGMAQGFDIYAAETVLVLKQQGHRIILVAAPPFKGFETAWSEQWRIRYTRIMTSADFIYYVGNEYSRSVFQKRNEWMADRSSVVIACYTEGQRGGTANMISYCDAHKIPVIYL